MIHLKLELNGLEGGGGLDAPDATVFGDLHNLDQNPYWGLSILWWCWCWCCVWYDAADDSNNDSGADVADGPIDAVLYDDSYGNDVADHPNNDDDPIGDALYDDADDPIDDDPNNFVADDADDPNDGDADNLNDRRGAGGSLPQQHPHPEHLRMVF